MDRVVISLVDEDDSDFTADDEDSDVSDSDDSEPESVAGSMDSDPSLSRKMTTPKAAVRGDDTGEALMSSEPLDTESAASG